MKYQEKFPLPTPEEIAATAKECGEAVKDYLDGHRDPINEEIAGNMPKSEKEMVSMIREINFYDGRDWDEKITDEETGEVLEREMKSIEMQIFYSINRITNDIILRHVPDFEKFNVPPRNVHIVKGNEEVYLPLPKQIILGDEHIKTMFAKKLAHEMIHLKQRSVLELEDDPAAAQNGVQKKPVLRSKSVGIATSPKSGKRLFNNLNEAVVEELTKEVCLNFDDPFLFYEREETEALRAKMGLQGEEDDDIFYIHAGENTKFDKTKEEEIVFRFNYPKEREILKVLTEKIFTYRDNLSEEDKRQFNLQTKEDIFNIFTRSSFSGDLRSVVKLIDHTLGSGTAQQLLHYEKKEKNGQPFNDVDGQLQFVKDLEPKPKNEKPK